MHSSFTSHNESIFYLFIGYYLLFMETNEAFSCVLVNVDVYYLVSIERQVCSLLGSLLNAECTMTFIFIIASINYYLKVPAVCCSKPIYVFSYYFILLLKRSVLIFFVFIDTVININMVTTIYINSVVV